MLHKIVGQPIPLIYSYPNICYNLDSFSIRPESISPGRGVKRYILDKKEIINQYKQHEGDTGSTGLQVALLTERINQLTGHMTTHRKDFHSQRGLMQLVGQRRRLLRYLNHRDVGQYRNLITKLGLRK